MRKKEQERLKEYQELVTKVGVYHEPNSPNTDSRLVSRLSPTNCFLLPGCFPFMQTAFVTLTSFRFNSQYIHGWALKMHLYLFSAVPVWPARNLLVLALRGGSVNANARFRFMHSNSDIYLCHRRWRRLCFHPFLFVYLCTGYLKKLWTGSVCDHDELIRFWWRSGSGSDY